MITELFRTQPGDVNLDGKIDSSDYVIIRKSFGISGAKYTQGDVDLDGDVDAADLSDWQGRFGFVRQPLQSGGGAGSAVPEPSSVLLLSVLAAIITTCSQRSPHATVFSNFQFYKARHT
jgi:hypothetical protein